eukprot:5420523-Ditylum_brightwellii.AAC.1
MHHNFIAKGYPLHHNVKQVAFNWIEKRSAGLGMPCFYDAPTDATARQIFSIKKSNQEGKIKKTLEYMKDSDWANTKFNIIANIFHKTEHEDQCASLLANTIQPLLKETLNNNGFDASTSSLILEAATFKSTIPKKTMQSST